MNTNALVKSLPVIIALAVLSACSGSPAAQGNGNGSTFTIGGAVSGLSGSGLVLQDNGGDNLTITKNGAFTFATAVASGGAYKVTVMTQPSNPAQTCTVSSGTGTATANVTAVAVSCATNGGGGAGGSFTIGGTVSGLTGSGLVLQDNGADNLTISGNGTFTFATSVTGAYAVTVLTQPTNPTQNCTVVNGTSTASANVTTVQVSCTATGGGSGFTIGGTVSGLTGTGLVVQDNGGGNLTINHNGPFTFATPVANGGTYAVTVLTQPTNPTQTCTVASGSGTATSNVGNVAVTCSVGTLSIGGFVSGLSGSGLVLQYNSGNSITIKSNGPFTFGALIASGASYSVAVATQPSNPAQTCTVTNASGTATANVTNVQVICPAVFFTIGGQVVGLRSGSTGMVLQDNGGDDLPITGNGAFTFDTPIANGSTYDVSLLTAATPAQGCVLWNWQGTATGNVTDITIDCGHGDWTWMDGANSVNSNGLNNTPKAGTQNSNTPGGRLYPSTWTDKNGNLWLFGGYGYYYDTTVAPQPALLDDMWEYSGTTSYFAGYGSFWTLTNPVGGPGPTGREGAATWTDASGNLWLFGGDDGLDFQNDLWEYNTSTNTWSVVTPAAGSIPGARWGMHAMFDGTNTVWIFGGEGYDSNGTLGLLNDLWTFTISTKQWTLISGSNLANQAGTYGALGASSSSYAPGGRKGAVTWLDGSGNFWVFGGDGLDSTGHPGALNDLWEYKPGTPGTWTWVSGSATGNQTGSYGTEGVASATNVPGGRWDAASWTDASGRFWLFGGQGFDSTGDGSLADLWEFSNGQWTWVNGPSSVSQIGVYGVAPNPVVWPYYQDYPGSRWGAGYWILNATEDLSGDSGAQFWMFGGEGFDATGTKGYGLLNDLWRYLPYP